MKRKKKSYAKPRKPHEKQRILDENVIKKKYGLKNKTEIWKADAKIQQIRQRAKGLISGDEKENAAFFDKLKKIGLNVSSIPDVLALTTEDLLKRRLQTVLVDKKLARTTRAARQLITHKQVLVKGEAVNIPSYIVPTSLENEIKLNLRPIRHEALKKKTESDGGILEVEN